MKKQNVSAKKIEISKPTLSSNEVTETIKGKIIVIQSSKEANKEADYIINKDGSVIEGKKNNDKVIICLVGGTEITWTPIVSMIKVIEGLKEKGAGKVERYDAFYPGKINPEFNLRQALIKYNVR